MTGPALQAVPTPEPAKVPGSKFNLARTAEYVKGIVATAGAIAAAIIMAFPNAPHWLYVLDGVLTAIGVTVFKNASPPNSTGEGFNDGQMSSASAATDGVGDPAHPASVDLPDLPAAPVTDPSPALPPLDLSGVEPPQS